MRDFKGMKRQRGRNRKPGGGGGGGGHNPNRAFESNGPDGVKIRGASQHVYERYHQLARDAFASGDRVLAENYLQHAEHYFRVLRTLQPQRPVAEIAARDAFASGFDIDFEDESGLEGGGELEAASAEGGEEGGEQPQPREERGERGERGEQRGERREREFRGERRDRDRDGERRDRDRDREGGERREREGGEARVDGERGFREGGRRESRRERFERRREERHGREREGGPAEAGAADPLAVVEPQAAPLPASAEAEGSPVLRAQDGAESQMPAFLRQPAPAVAATPESAPEAEAAERPRRTRRKRPESFEAAEGEAAPATADEG